MKKMVDFKVRQLGLMLLLILSVLNLFSCKNAHEKTFEELQSEYALIGDYHEMGLNYILDDLKESCINKETKPGIDQMSKTIKASSVRFTVEILGLNQESEESILRLQESFKLNIAKSDLNESLLTLIDPQVSLSDKQVYYLSELDKLLSENIYDIYQCINAIRNLEYHIYNNCSPEEIPLLFIATSIGANSIAYWYNNFDIWESEIDMTEVSASKGTMHKEWFWGALSRMGKADIAGGLVGAGFGALAGGVGAIPGALAGACNSSGICGLVVIYEHLTE